MSGYKEPAFQDRVAQAQKARDKALRKHAERPPLDPEVEEQRKQARLAREAAAAEKRAARNEAIAQAKADKQAAAKQAAKPVPTEAERKEARDEKYAARKKRKK